MSEILNRLSLAKLLMKFTETVTQLGKLISEGPLAEGVEVFIENEDGELVAAPDGEYIAEDNTKYTVVDGKVTAIESVEVDNPDELDEGENNNPVELEDEPGDNPDESNADKDAEIETLKAEIVDLENKVNELSADIADRDKQIEDLKSQLEEANKKLEMSSDVPADKKLKMSTNTINNKENKVLKYFK